MIVRTRQRPQNEPERPWILATHKGDYGKLLLAARPFQKSLCIVRPAIKRTSPRISYEPLYFDYVFLRALSGSLFVTIKHLPVKVVCLGDKTLSITQAEMDKITEITRTLAYQAAHPPGAQEFVQEHKGKQVTITGGSACGMSGIVDSEASTRDVFVRIAGLRIRVPMDRLDVETVGVTSSP